MLDKAGGRRRISLGCESKCPKGPEDERTPASHPARVRPRGAREGAAARLLDQRHGGRPGGRTPFAVALRGAVDHAGGRVHLPVPRVRVPPRRLPAGEGGRGRRPRRLLLPVLRAAGVLPRFQDRPDARAADQVDLRGGRVVLVSLLLIGIAAGWTAFAFALLAIMYDGLFGWGHIMAIGVTLAIVGIFNNLFGFTGITAFARYLVAPLMILWMLYLVIKGFARIDELGGTPPVGEGAFPLPFLSGVALAIGSVMWGNEPDTWRYGRPRFLWPLVPYTIALAIGLVLFVIGGW